MLLIDKARLWSDNPGRAATEKYFLWYTPVWGLVVGLVMLTGLAERWGDWELMAIGLLVFAGALGPLVRRVPGEVGLPLYRTAAFRILLSLTLFSFLLNYFGTAYFYEVLHAHYGFQATWNLNNVPFFLWLMTVAYFGTYFSLLSVGFRLCQQLFAGRSKALYWLSLALLAYLVAGLESVMNANPFMKGLYCFDDLAFALGFGTFFYGNWFIAVMPFWLTIEEGDKHPHPLRRAIVGALAACMLCICVGEVVKWKVAPYFTEVKHGHVGLRDYGSSCLEPPAPKP